MMKFILSLVLCFSLSISANAQEKDVEAPNSGPRKQIATVIYAGLGGAVLGLSTLSFHGRPQDHLGNIAAGFAIGIIVGAVISSYSVATEPEKLYSGHFESLEKQGKWAINSNPLTLNYAWSF